MGTLISGSRLDAFAREYLAPFGHHAEIRSEHLAEAVRSAFGLSAFPNLAELLWLCDELGIERGALPPELRDVRGANSRYGSAPPRILLAQDLTTRLVETTIVHELREVFENAFRHVDPTYVGLDTHDNATMNAISDRFGGFLLMETDASHDLMAEVGFDLLEFSRRVGRSLPSVLMRARYLYPRDCGIAAPVLGAWLFVARWDLVKAHAATPGRMRLQKPIALAGFSQAKGTPEAAVFPRPKTDAGAFQITSLAVTERMAVARRLAGFDLFNERGYLVVAEPEFRFDTPWRVLLTAIRGADIALVMPWLGRLGMSTKAEEVTSL